MNTDRELLEAAAKAAGIYAIWHSDVAGLALTAPAPVPRRFWNPLTDDGDALRLAVTLYLEIAPCRALPPVGRPNPCTIVCDGEPASFRVEESGPDAYANTRRAIVRAAAAMAAG